MRAPKRSITNPEGLISFALKVHKNMGNERNARSASLYSGVLYVLLSTVKARFSGKIGHQTFVR